MLRFRTFPGKVLLAGLLMVAGGGALAQSYRSGDLITGQPVVVDGHHLDIKSDRIRIWGIDTPVRSASCFRSAKRWRPADDAADALRRCVRGKTVTCRVWSVERRWFRTRYMSECWTEDGLDVGDCMVRAGWATDYTCFSDGFYKDLETEAKNKGLGLWSCDNGPGTRRWGRNGAGAPCEDVRYKPTGPGSK
jgi:endonuclease YncB( thermonuclease family)